MKLHWTLAVALLAALTLFGCSDSTEPPTGDPGDGTGDFQGQIDPVGQSFVLKSLDVTQPDGIPIRIELVGRLILTRGPERPGEVALAVAIRNIDHRDLFAPAEVILSRFNPVSVAPVPGNPDWTTCPDDSLTDVPHPPIGDCRYGYGYSRLFGDDGILGPGETSGERIWVFYDPEMVPFSFAAHVRLGIEPDRPRIAGLFFSDPNRNGQHDPDEPPSGGGAVRVSGPGIEELWVQVMEDGRYSVPVQDPGLYNLWAVPPPTFAPFAPVEFTTPNPLEVILVRNADGRVGSFLHADFGVANVILDLPPVQFTEDETSLSLDQYTLEDIRPLDTRLYLRVGIGGCTSDHPLQLFMVGGFMESNPVQARLLLMHDDREEPCDAWFERDLAFDLRPILERYRRMYGEYGTVLLRFEAWNGEMHQFELSPANTDRAG